MAHATDFIHIDNRIKKQREELYEESGINLAQPNPETIAAMLEAKRMASDPSMKRYSDVEEVLKALKG